MAQCTMQCHQAGSRAGTERAGFTCARWISSILSCSMVPPRYVKWLCQDETPCSVPSGQSMFRRGAFGKMKRVPLALHRAREGASK